MNPIAYRTTGLAIKTLSGFSRANLRTHAAERLPTGSIIFVANHFTRFETLFLPYIINKLHKIPVWSLAAAELFNGPLKSFFDRVGVVSTGDPHRDRLIVKTLLTGEAVWIIFPEGRMVKNKKIVEGSRFMISYEGGKHPPHTGAAILALRTEFYRRQFRRLADAGDKETLKKRMAAFGVDKMGDLLDLNTYIVPVNLTYYPMRTKENLISQTLSRVFEEMSDRMLEEVMTEGTLLLEGADVDIRFGEPIDISQYFEKHHLDRAIPAYAEASFEEVLPARQILRRAAVRLMNRYMRAVYDMTTVNHDHIFAALLRQIPRRRILAADFCRRVYLAVANLQKMPRYHLHQSLQMEQSSLLASDRYGKLADFISVGQATKKIRWDGRTIEKLERKMVSTTFHRSRMDDPFSVMANEIEPLRKLYRRLRWLAWMPRSWVRRRTAKLLLARMQKEFDEDYERYQIQGESKPASIGRPLLIPGRRGRSGVLLLHGYLAAPAEVASLAHYLSRMGHWVCVPRLKGHGTSPEDLARRSYQEWMDSVDTGYALIAAKCRNVVVGGFSTGAALALELSTRVAGIKGVFAICPPMRLQDFSARLVPAVDVWNRFMEMVRLDKAKMEFVENQSENPKVNYLRNPIAGVRELDRLMDALAPKLASIGIPTLIMQSLGDPVVDPEGTRQLFRKIGAREKSYIVINSERHNILLGNSAARVQRDIEQFLVRLG